MQAALGYAAKSAMSSPQIRVMQCIPTLGGGGAETQLRLIAPLLAKEGIGVSIFGRLLAEDVADLGARGVTCFPIESRGNYNFLTAVELLRAIEAFRPTVIQTWLPQMDIMVGAIALAKRIPWILSERASALAYGAGWKDRLRNVLGRRAELIVANSVPGSDYWSAARNVTVVGNGLDLAALRAAPIASGNPADMFRGRPTVVTVSRLSKEKRLDVLIEAIALARRSLPTIRLILIGDGPERAALEGCVCKYELEDNVHFAGFQRNPDPWVRSAEIFASMSRYEGQPNSVMEAAACGTPMVLSNIAEHRLLMGDAALYAPVDDAAACAAQLVSLARSPQMLSKLATAGRRTASRLDICVAVKQYAAIYERLTAAGPGNKLSCPDRPTGEANR